MAKLMITMLCIFLYSFIHAQEIKLYKGKGDKKNVRKAVDPVDSGGINPFLNALRIELIHYPNRMSWWDKLKGADSPLIQKGELMIPKDRILYRIPIVKTDFKAWEESIYDPYVCAESMVSGCYFPRHMLLFYDENDKLFGYIEICIECTGFHFSPKLKTTVCCPERTEDIKRRIKIAERSTDTA